MAIDILREDCAARSAGRSVVADWQLSRRNGVGVLKIPSNGGEEAVVAPAFSMDRGVSGRTSKNKAPSAVMIAQASQPPGYHITARHGATPAKTPGRLGPVVFMYHYNTIPPGGRHGGLPTCEKVPRKFHQLLDATRGDSLFYLPHMLGRIRALTRRHQGLHLGYHHNSAVSISVSEAMELHPGDGAAVRPLL